MLLLGDCNDWIKDIKDNSIDLLVTDPPYGIEFMGKDWDRVVVPTDTWKECYRVLKQGKLAFIMCSPRQDVLARMIINLQDAGFRTNYSSIYWTYASGFPKAANVSKLIDKKNGRYFDTSVKDYLNQKRKEKGLSFYDVNKYLDGATNGGGIASAYMGDKQQNELPTLDNYNKLKTLLGLDNRFDELIEREEAEREIIGNRKTKDFSWHDGSMMSKENTIDYSTKTTEIDITKPATEEAKKMEGAYVGFQPKPAVEVILVVSKGRTITWLDDCRIPYQSEDDMSDAKIRFKVGEPNTRFLPEYGWHNNKMVTQEFNPEERKGRFPANLLVSDDVLNDGKSWRGAIDNHKASSIYGNEMKDKAKGWGKEEFGSYSRYFSLDQWAEKTLPFLIVPKASKGERGEFNVHPTVKALKLMSYLITMGSREGDLVLDPFCGSGTVCIAADQLHRKWIGIEKNPEYAEIIKKRLMVLLSQLKLTVYSSSPVEINPRTNVTIISTPANNNIIKNNSYLNK